MPPAQQFPDQRPVNSAFLEEHPEDPVAEERLQHAEESGEEIDMWSARDALVLKALSLVLAPRLGLSAKCCHLKGHGGSKLALQSAWEHLDHNRFVLRTDFKLYYASFDHLLLLDRLARFITDPRLLSLISQYLTRSAECGRLYWHYHTGISLGCPLSPIMGAFFLSEADDELEKHGLFLRRFMDDILVLAPTRWKLRRVVKGLNQRLAALKLDKQPARTFIGRIDKGFDFLGYHFAPGRLSIARSPVEAFVERARRLYEQELGGSRLGQYVQRWVRWANAELDSGITGTGNFSIIKSSQSPVGAACLLTGT